MLRSRILAPSALLLAGALAAAGCGESATEPDGDLSVATAVAPTTFRPGDLVTVTVTVTNSGSRTRSVLADACEDPFTLTAADGTVLPPAPRVCTLDVKAPREVAPGGSVAITRGWRGDVGSTTGSLGATPAPGTYTVRGFARTTDGATVVSNAPVQVQILAR